MSYPVTSPQDRLIIANADYQAARYIPATTILNAMARDGFANAQIMLGAMYEFGVGGLPRNLNLARSLYTMGAPKLPALGYHRLAITHIKANGPTPRAVAEAMALMKLSAASGCAQAQTEVDLAYGMGRFMNTGMPVPQDDRKAVHWLMEAAENNQPLAMRYLAELHEEERGGLRHDKAEVGRLLGRAAQTGDADARCVYAMSQLDGTRGIEKNNGAAIETLRELAEGGNSKGLANLASAYLTGNPALVSPVKTALMEKKRLSAVKIDAVQELSLYRQIKTALLPKKPKPLPPLDLSSPTKAAILYCLAKQQPNIFTSVNTYCDKKINSQPPPIRAWGKRGAARIMGRAHKPD